MQKKFKNKTRAFTLMETLIALSIFILIVLALTLFAKNIWVYNSFLQSDLTNVDAGRQALKTMVSEIRTASTANTGAYAIGFATAGAFTFYSDIDNDGLREKVRYFITDTTLQKGVIKPTGAPLSYNTLNEKISTLMTNLTSFSIFEYYDKNYDGTTGALTNPINIPVVRLIKITISTDQDPNRSPVPKIFSTQVSIRNLKDNL